MIRVRDNKQLPLFDPWAYLGPKRRAMLDASWAGLFKELCLPNLPVDMLAACFSRTQGRPSKELLTSPGVRHPPANPRPHRPGNRSRPGF